MITISTAAIEVIRTSVLYLGRALGQAPRRVFTISLMLLSSSSNLNAAYRDAPAWS